MNRTGSPLKDLLDKKTRRTVGLMSGTSADGVDLAYCEVNVGEKRLNTLHTLSVAYPEPLRLKVLDLAAVGRVDLKELIALSQCLGHFYVKAIEHFLAVAKLAPDDIDLIGSHGQTVAHLATPVRILQQQYRGTLQLGEAELIAKKLGVVVVSDFRAADVAVGGSGAPLTPIYHQHRFATPNRTRLIVNIGGIVNITLLAGEQCLATDTGPGNCLIDHLMNLIYRRSHDRNGEIALSGTIDNALLSRLQGDPIFRQKPPVSLDRKVTIDIIKRRQIQIPKDTESRRNLITTVSELTVWSIHRGLRRLAPAVEPDEVLICGGGFFNEYVRKRLRDYFAGSIVTGTNEYGVDPAFVEAEAFACLANLALDSAVGNVTAATGADRSVILGKISQP